MLFLTNIQQLYDRSQRKQNGDEEPEIMTEMLGPKPKDDIGNDPATFFEMLSKRSGRLLLLNDEAHHTHDEENEWNSVIRRLHTSLPLTAQLDFSATPRFTKGALFPWTVSDYPIKQAILDGIVKRPVKGIADIDEAKSNVASVRYQGYLTAGVERWREYKEQLAPLDKKPLLFIMMNTTEEAEDVGDWLRSKYPGDFGGEHKTLVIHTDKSGEISKKDLDKARKLAREVDDPDCPTNAIVSVAFLTFVDDLEKLEDIQLETFEVGKDKLKIISISPQVPEKAAYTRRSTSSRWKKYSSSNTPSGMPSSPMRSSATMQK